MAYNEENMALAPLAFAPEGLVALMIPIIALMIPIVVVLSRHQQRMAEILHGQRNDQEFRALQMEVEQLRSIVHQQAFVLERLNSAALTSSSDIQQRVNL